MIVAFTVLHVYIAFLICAKCEQDALNGSLTVYHQTFFPPAAVEFPSFAPRGGWDCDFLQLLWSNNFFVMFFEVINHTLVMILTVIYKFL